MVNKGSRKILIVGDDIMGDDPARVFPELVLIIGIRHDQDDEPACHPGKLSFDEVDGI